MTKKHFDKIINEMYNMAPHFAKKCQPCFKKNDHKWSDIPADKITAEDVCAMICRIIGTLNYHEGFPFYSASCGGITVQIVVWPSSSPEARIYYSPEGVLKTFPAE